MQWCFNTPKTGPLSCVTSPIHMRVTREGQGGEISPALFQNLEKSALIFGKNVLTRFIYGFNFSFKIMFYAYLSNFSLQGLFSVCFRLNVYRSAFIFRNLPCPEKFLVTHLIQKEKIKTVILSILNVLRKNY